MVRSWYVCVEDGDEDTCVWEASRRECVSDTLNGCIVDLSFKLGTGWSGVSEETGKDVEDGMWKDGGEGFAGEFVATGQTTLCLNAFKLSKGLVVETLFDSEPASFVLRVSVEGRCDLVQMSASHMLHLRDLSVDRLSQWGEYFVAKVLNRPSKTAFLALGMPLCHADAPHKQLVARVGCEDGTHSARPANTPTEVGGQCMTNNLPCGCGTTPRGIVEWDCGG